jgi:hypothetical protein
VVSSFEWGNRPAGISSPTGHPVCVALRGVLAVERLAVAPGVDQPAPEQNNGELLCNERSLPTVSAVARAKGEVPTIIGQCTAKRFGPSSPGSNAAQLISLYYADIPRSCTELPSATFAGVASSHSSLSCGADEKNSG